jgi:hypothetical protein
VHDSSRHRRRVKKGKPFIQRKHFHQGLRVLARLIIMTNKIKWLVNDLGLNELNAWLWITGGAALTALGLVLLSDGGAEVFRYWRVAGLNLL